VDQIPVRLRDGFLVLRAWGTRQSSPSAGHPRTMSSSPAVISARASSSVTTVDIGVLPRRRFTASDNSFWSTRKVRGPKSGGVGGSCDIHLTCAMSVSAGRHPSAEGSAEFLVEALSTQTRRAPKLGIIAARRWTSEVSRREPSAAIPPISSPKSGRVEGSYSTDLDQGRHPWGGSGVDPVPSANRSRRLGS
jgi:hypothetical protein